MLFDIIRFEYRYLIRQAVFFAAAAFFLFIGFVLTATGFGPENLKLNSPYLVMQSFAFVSLFSVFAVAIFASNAVLRDTDNRMEEIIFSTPVGKFNYFAGRFAGCYLVTLTAVSFAALGMIAATFMPWQEASRIGNLRIQVYVWCFLAVWVPNILVVTALLLGTAVVTRKAVTTYVAATFIYILYFAAAAFTNSPLMAASVPGAGGGIWPALLDPFGLSAFFEVTRYWTPAVRNSRILFLDGTFAANRILWLIVSFLLAVFVYKLFSFRLMKRAASRKESLGGADTDSYTPPDKKRSEIPVSPGSWITSYLAASRIELGMLLKSLPFLLLITFWMILAGTELYADIFNGEYGTSLFPTTGLIITTLRQPLQLMGMILLIYYSGEIFWREQNHRFDALINTTPVRGSVMIASKFTAMVAIICLLILGGILVGVLLQLMAGYTNFQPSLYLSLFYFSGLQLALFAAAAVFIHAWSPNRYVGFIVLLFFIVFSVMGHQFGLQHHLWRFASAPSMKYTDMNGFGKSAGFHWYMFYWVLWGTLFVYVASLLWRVVGREFNDRIKYLGKTRPQLRIAAFVVMLAAGGSWIFYNTNVLNDYTSDRELFDWKADYERTYRRISNLPSPRVVSLVTKIDLYPEERHYHVAGHYDVVNDSTSPMTEVYIAVRRDARDPKIVIPGAKLLSRDVRFGMYTFELKEPLLPGEQLGFTFDLSYKENGFTDRDPDYTIVSNGSFVMSFRSFPTFGYRKTYELTDPAERKKRGLTGTGTSELEADPALGTALDAPEWIDFSADVSTSAGQIALAPGRLVKIWEQNGRRHFTYRTNSKILNRFGISSAKYEVERKPHNGVDIEIYYHPGHKMNVSSILETTAASLDKFSKEFRPYPYTQLRIVELPLYWPAGGLAMPDSVYLVENRSFLIDTRKKDIPDLLMRRVAHEVAHLWWGFQVAPKNIEGASSIIESLAKYSELQIVRERYGREHVRALLEMEIDRYLSGRANEPLKEPPLYKVGDQAYLYYGKGALVMNAIADLIGHDSMNSALAAFTTEYGAPNSNATSLDLLRHILDAAPRAHRELIEQWMKEIVLYDLKLESASVQKRDDGRYDVKMVISAAKSKDDGGGNSLSIPLNEDLEIGVFKTAPHLSSKPDNVLYLRKHPFRSGKNEVRVIVDGKPEFVAVDPYLTRIDPNRFDNSKSISQ